MPESPASRAAFSRPWQRQEPELRQPKKTMSVLSIASIAVWALAAALLMAYVTSVASEVTYVTLADGRKAERSIPLIIKILLPFAPNFFRLIKGNGFAALREKYADLLIQAGFEGVISTEEFIAMKFMLGWIFPDLWLYRTIKARHLSIMKALPFVLDILTLSVEAGMDFISALARNCKSRKMDALNEELLRMTKEIQIGVTRREALKNMAERVKEHNLKNVANSLIQADELGVSISSILRIQSEQLHSRRFDRAESLAAQAPVKMLGPLLLCIFPAVFIILLGPLLMQAMKGSL